ncbi:hypothetical protein AMJ49_05645 [Parcubacteria bacterium DG_74_2]|nr:MAG: hypothetical protein AMJ49_05645 [Parcubacteria bacterium DG_74_2]
MQERYDLIVVGAGPAGSWTAKTAAEYGLDVFLIERKPEIGVPLQCAEGVTKQGLEKFLEPEKKWVAKQLKGSYIYPPDETKIFIPQKKSKVGYILERKIFDRALVEKAVRKGVQVSIKTEVKGLLIEQGFVKGVQGLCFGKDFKVRADIVIGADGVVSNVGKWAGIDTKSEIMSCAQFLVAGIEIDSDYSEFYLGNEIAPGGYAWVFPKGEDTANIGLGIDSKRLNKGLTIFDYLQRFVKKKFSEGEIIEVISGGVPVAPIKRIVANGLMLVGDAARQVNPLTGGGIINAMEAGTMAGQVAVKAIERGDVSMEILREYQKSWHESMIGKHIIRMYKAKKVITGFNNEDLNKIGHSLKEVDLEGVSSVDLLKILIGKNPRILWNLRDLFKT